MEVERVLEQHMGGYRWIVGGLDFQRQKNRLKFYASVELRLEIPSSFSSSLASLERLYRILARSLQSLDVLSNDPVQP